MKIDFQQEYCCDYCGEGIHVHIEQCPSCKTNFAGTSIGGNLHEAWADNEIPEFSCEHCKALFRASKTYIEISKNEGIHYTDWKIV